MTESQASPAAPVFMTRMAILDANRRLWGYELLGRNGEAGPHPLFADTDQAARTLASSTYIRVQQAMERGKKLLVGFDEQGVLDKAPYAFPSAHGVVKLIGGVTDAPALSEALTRMKDDGYTLAVAVCDRDMPPGILDLADILTCNLTRASDPKKRLAELKSRNAVLLAEGVHTLHQFDLLKNAGFSLFAGAFFKEPEVVAERKLTSHQLSRFNLLKLIEAEDPDFDVLADAIGADVSVSFRLLSYLNSAAFGFPQKIQSIKHAITVLGVIKMKNWLRAVLLADMAQQGDRPQELVLLSLQRGRFLERIGTEYDFFGFDPGSLFLLGLFSLLDALLGMPMGQVVSYLPLEEKLKAALRREANNEYQPLLDLAACLEDADWARLDQLTPKLGFEAELVKQAYTDAMAWAGAFFSSQAKPA